MEYINLPSVNSVSDCSNRDHVTIREINDVTVSPLATLCGTEGKTKLKYVTSTNTAYVIFNTDTITDVTSIGAGLAGFKLTFTAG